MSLKKKKPRKNTAKKYLKKKVCIMNRDMYDYKEVDELRRFVSEKGKIMPRRMTGMNAKDQRQLSKSIKRSRHAGLLSFTSSGPQE